MGWKLAVGIWLACGVLWAEDDGWLRVNLKQPKALSFRSKKSAGDGNRTNDISTVEKGAVTLPCTVDLDAKRAKDSGIASSQIAELLPASCKESLLSFGKAETFLFKPQDLRLQKPYPCTVNPGKVTFGVEAHLEGKEADSLFVAFVDAPEVRKTGFTAAKELLDAKLPKGLNPDLLSKVIGGQVSGIKTFRYPAHPEWSILEVQARREARPGKLILVWNALVPKVQLLAHTFRVDLCHRTDETSFEGVLDFNGDGKMDVLVGPRPRRVFELDGNGWKFHEAFQPPCRC